MSTKINVRSPYYVSSSHPSLSSVVIEIFVYSISKPATPQYTIKKYAISGSTNITFDISNLVLDYIDTSMMTNAGATTLYAGSSMWVDVDIDLLNSSGTSITTNSTTYLATNGYGYFEDSGNPIFGNTYLQSNDIIYRYANNIFRVPVYDEDVTNVSFYNDSELLYSQSITPDTTSTGKIKYVTNLQLGGYESFEYRVINDGGTIEKSICLSQFYKQYELYDIDEVRITSSTGIESIKVETINECKYTPIKVTFYNKYGALQDVWFFKKSSSKLNTSKDTYSSNGGRFYNPQQAQTNVYNLKANETIQLNTGFIDEQYSEIMKQLLLSENVWATITNDLPFGSATDTEPKTDILPVVVDTNSLDIQTKLNDKLINYTLDFSFAFNKINDVT